MYDINNPPVVEPDDTVKFSRYPGALRNHVEKHVLYNRDERWFQLPEFDPELLASAREGDIDSFRVVARLYVDTLKRALLACCRSDTGHQHFQAIRSPIPGRLVGEPVFANYDRKPEQVIKCLSKKEKLFIVARARVINGVLQPYSIRTGYRLLPTISGDAWLKKGIFKTRDIWSITGKRQEKIIDHLGGKN